MMLHPSRPNDTRDKMTHEIIKVAKETLRNKPVLDLGVENFGGGTKVFKVK